MKNLKENYPNVIEGMSNKWLERFEKSKNNEVVERLFNYLEEKISEESKKLDPLTEDLTITIAVINRNYKNCFQINLEKMVHDSEFDAWEGIEEYPVALEIEIKDYYKNWEESCIQEMVDDFLENLPENLDLALI